MHLAVLALAATAFVTTSAAGLGQDLSTCGGETMRRFIGKPVKEMQRSRKEKVRYVCEGCAMTMDFNPERLTVVYSDKTGLVNKMGCN